MTLITPLAVCATLLRETNDDRVREVVCWFVDANRENTYLKSDLLSAQMEVTRLKSENDFLLEEINRYSNQEPI